MSQPLAFRRRPSWSAGRHARMPPPPKAATELPQRPPRTVTPLSFTRPVCPKCNNRKPRSLKHTRWPPRRPVARVPGRRRALPEQPWARDDVPSCFEQFRFRSPSPTLLPFASPSRWAPIAAWTFSTRVGGLN